MITVACLKEGCPSFKQSQIADHPSIFKVETGQILKPPYQWAIPSYSSICKLTRSFRLVSYVKIYPIELGYHRNEPHVANIFLGNQNLQHLQTHGHSKHFVKWYHLPGRVKSWNPGSKFIPGRSMVQWSSRRRGLLCGRKERSHLWWQPPDLSWHSQPNPASLAGLVGHRSEAACRLDWGNVFLSLKKKKHWRQNTQNHPKWNSGKNVLDWFRLGPWRGISCQDTLGG